MIFPLARRAVNVARRTYRDYVARMDAIGVEAAPFPSRRNWEPALPPSADSRFE
jgi:hypothetical protein